MAGGNRCQTLAKNTSTGEIKIELKRALRENSQRLVARLLGRTAGRR